MRRVITFGTFDVLHIGHIRILKRARAEGDALIVGLSSEKKRDYIIQHKADVLVMGDDWYGKFDEFKDICDVVYLPRTPSISTTEIIEIIKESSE